MLLILILFIPYIRITQAEKAGGFLTLAGKIKLDFRKILKFTETESQTLD